jgi:predicted metal-dependent hydrolase
VRRLPLVGQPIDYRLVRSRRQSIEMTIDHAGLVVRAPRWVAIREVELALRERAAWVVETLAEWRDRGRESLPTEWQAGAPCLPGSRVTLALFPAPEPRSMPTGCT